MSRLQFAFTRVGLVVMLAFIPWSAHTQADDLDEIDDATLLRLLEAELDDIYAVFDDPESEVSLSDLKAAMLYALGDEGDESDPAEEQITFEELNDEMAEADTSLGEVLDDALEEADGLASIGGPAWSIVRVGITLDRVAQQRVNGRTTPRQAARQAARALVRKI
jgi:hypothetical protein